MRHLLLVAVLAVLAIVGHAQTITAQDINGNTIVEVITLNLGLPTTSTIETLTAAAPPTTTSTNIVTTIPTTTSTTTAADQEQGPVGQPATTVFTPGGPTPFTFTTVIDGVTSVIQDVFTPTNPITQQPTVTTTGTIWDFSSWLAIYGPTTTGSAGANGAAGCPLASVCASTLVLSFAVGMGLVL